MVPERGEKAKTPSAGKSVLHRRSVHRRVVALAVLFIGCGPADEEPPPPVPRGDAPLASDVAAGGELYQRYCALCHGEHGEGYLADNAPAITGDAFLRVASDEFLTRAITEGHPGTPMAAFGQAQGGPLLPEEVLRIVAFLRSEGPPPIDVSRTRVMGDAGRGRSVYDESCASCHGARGEGVNAPTLAHPVFQSSASVGFLRETIARGRDGTPMPAFQGTLSSQAIDDVVAYVRTLAPIGAPAPPVPDGPPPPDFDHLVLSPEGEAPEFTVREDRYVPGAEVRRALDEHRRIVILDARATSAWAEAHIPGAAPFPYYSIEDLASHLPNDGTYIIAYCACPHAASGHVVDELRRRNFEHAYILDEGIGWWQSEGHPVERGAASP